MTSNESTTQTRILDAAENLFADNGFSATSLRKIIHKAGVNTASVHYHFGSRAALIEAVLRRRAEPVNRERLKLLEMLEAECGRGPLPVDRVIRAFVEPAIRVKYHGGSGCGLPKLMARAIAESDESIHAAVREIFGGVFLRFGPAFKRAVPDINMEELYVRIHFMIGAMAFSIAVDPLRATAVRKAMDAPQLTAQLVEFIAAGMRAPAPETGKAGTRGPAPKTGKGEPS